MRRPIFFGTPDFAVPTLRALCEAGHQPLLVVTQPARPQGRGRRLQQPPVAEWAMERRLPVEQPETVKDDDFLDRLRRLDPSVAVVVAFGQIFPAELLRLPSGGCVNVHASLLPKYRGAAPIQAAIMAGETVTGVTTMLMEEGLDTGPILLQRELEIGAEETAGELAPRLAELGAELLVETLEAGRRGDLQPRIQDHRAATLAPRLRRRDGRVDWQRSAPEIFLQLRGLTPWPGLSSRYRDEPLKILWGRPVVGESATTSEPGVLLGLRQERLVVACGGGTAFGIERLQRAGRRAVAAADFVRGQRLEPGERFG